MGESLNLGQKISDFSEKKPEPLYFRYYWVGNVDKICLRDQLDAMKEFIRPLQPQSLRQEGGTLDESMD